MENEALISLFKEYVWQPENFTNSIWYEDDCSNVTWNGEGNLHDLMQEDGDTYSACIYETIEIGKFVLMTISNDCGWRSQAFFSLDKKVDADKYWEEYEEAEEDE